MSRQRDAGHLVRETEPSKQQVSSAMDYLPTLTLNFSGGTTNSYRLRENHIEFQTGDGTWRILDSDDVQLHFLLHTEVAKWLLQHMTEMNPHTRDVQPSSK